MALPIRPSVVASAKPAPNRLPYPCAPCRHWLGVSAACCDAGPRSHAGEENWIGETLCMPCETSSP